MNNDVMRLIKKTFLLVLLITNAKMHSITELQEPNKIEDRELMMNTVATHKNEPHVLKKVLANGMTVLVRPVHTLPKVSLQIWYNVGSKDEKTSEKGIAHLIEHMIFKGTKQLSESDINIITHMLSGSTNAFTSYDYTGYLCNYRAPSLILELLLSFLN